MLLIACGAMGFQKIIPPVLNSFTDQDSRVRYYSCEALYNIAKVGTLSSLYNLGTLYWPFDFFKHLDRVSRTCFCWPQGRNVGSNYVFLKISLVSSSLIQEVEMFISLGYHEGLLPQGFYIAFLRPRGCMQVTRGELVLYFNDIFDALCKLSADSEPSVQQAAHLLDRLVKVSSRIIDIFECWHAQVASTCSRCTWFFRIRGFSDTSS